MFIKKCTAWLTPAFWLFLCSAFASNMHNTLEMKGDCNAFEVRLPANPTTGFQWTIEQFDRTHFNFIQDTYIASDTQRMGAPGEHVFYFEKKIDEICPEKTTLCFTYSRAWEKTMGHCTEVTIQFLNVSDE